LDFIGFNVCFKSRHYLLLQKQKVDIILDYIFERLFFENSSVSITKSIPLRPNSQIKNLCPA
jgi:hypothetical protein